MSEQELKRMRWASRRGMLELDLMLEPFVNDCYSGMNEVDRGRFRALMECEDQDLFGWFSKGVKLNPSKSPLGVSPHSSMSVG